MTVSYYGIDFHVNRFTYHVIRVHEDGSIERETKTLYVDEIWTKFIPHLTKNDYICLEALTGSFCFSTILKKYVKEVLVLNPYDLKQITASSKKSDKIDARKLANMLKYHIESKDSGDNFPEVYIPGEEVRELRSLFTTYNLLKKEKGQLKNRIHSIMKDNLISYKATNYFRHFNRGTINNLKISDVYKIQMEILYKQLLNTEEMQNQAKDEILKHGLKNFEREIYLLLGIKGISDLIACALIADFGDIKRFKTANKFVAYMRSSPRLHSSNEKTYNGKIDKKGRKLSFSLLLQGLTHIKNGNPNFLDFYEKKINGKSKGKVRSAIVRKTFVTIYYMLKNNDEYKFKDEKTYDKKVKEIERFKKKLRLAS